jgi:hypothetical protein
MLIVDFTTVDNNTFAYISPYRYTIVYKGKTMKHILTKYSRIAILMVMAVAIVSTTYGSAAWADPMRNVACKDGKTITVPGSDSRSDQEICKSNGGAKVVPTASTGDTSAPTCAVLPQDICNAATTKGTDVKKTGVYLLLVWVLNIMTAGVGIAAVGALVYAGVLYASAEGKSDQVAKAKQIITNTVVGIVVYALMFLVVNWLVPGGVIG